MLKACDADFRNMSKQSVYAKFYRFCVSKAQIPDGVNKTPKN